MQKFYILTLFLAILSCEKNTVKNKEEVEIQNNKNLLKLEDSIAKLNKVINETKNTKVQDSTKIISSTKYGYIRDFKNKYPTEVKLFTSGVLSKRIKKLLGNKDYSLFLQNFAVESPIEIVNDEYVFLNGGAAHLFGTCESAIYIDFIKDEITVGILNEGDLKIFSESKIKNEGGFNSNSFYSWYYEAKQNADEYNK